MNAFVPPGYLSFDDAIDRVAEITTLARDSTSPAAIEQRRLGKEGLQKLLYTEQIPSAVIKEDGSCHPTPGSIWGGEQWNDALCFNRITFPSNSYGAYVSGRPIIPKDALEEAFTPDGTPRSTAEASSAQETPMPRHQYRTRLLDVLEQIWSDIDASDWKATPPKKVAIEADLQNRFELSDRDARAIATVFVPDEKRGKAKKG